MIEYRTLNKTSINIVYHAFMEVFSDYQVAFHFSYNDFQNVLLKKGYNQYMSIGAFEDGRLIGFVLNGLRRWNQQFTIYDIGTGVIPSMRGQGITTQMLIQVKQLITDKNIHQYLLEVIQTNKNALSLYQKNGFQIQRQFKSYQIQKEEYQLIQNHYVKHVEYQDICQLQHLWNCSPSWQNSYDSILAIKEQFIYSAIFDKDQIIGYGIIDKNNGEIPQIAVHPQYRNQGIGRSILTDLINSTTSSLIKVINVEDCITQVFLNQLHFKNTVNQYEMMLYL